MSKRERESRRGIILGQLRNLHTMLHDMAQRGQAIASGCRRYWTGRYEQLLDTARVLDCLQASEDSSWRQAFGTTLAVLADPESMRRARKRYQAAGVLVNQSGPGDG